MLSQGDESIRIYPEPRLDEPFKADVARLQKFLPASPMQVIVERHAMRFPWMPGRTLDAVPQQTRIDAIRSLLRSQAASLQTNVAKEASDLVGTALRAGSMSDRANAETFALLRDHPSTSLLAGLPLMLQHGDPGSGNVIISSDGAPALVDWSPLTLGRRPFWSDAAHLVSIDHHGPLLGGAFDAELVDLWRAAGVKPPGTRDLRRLMAFAGVLFYATISLSVDSFGRAISLTTGAPPNKVSKPEKVTRTLERLPSAAWNA